MKIYENRNLEDLDGEIWVEYINLQKKLEN